MVPWEQRVADEPGLVVRRTRNLDERRHPSRSVPQTWVEHTVLDVAQLASRPDKVVSWVLTACQRRATMPERLATALATWPRHRHRRLILEGLRWHPVDLRWRDDVRDNVAVLSGDAVLRFGWRAVVGSPCDVAAQAPAVLRDRGWQGEPHPCGPGCPVGRTE